VDTRLANKMASAPPALLLFIVVVATIFWSRHVPRQLSAPAPVMNSRVSGHKFWLPQRKGVLKMVSKCEEQKFVSAISSSDLWNSQEGVIWLVGDRGKLRKKSDTRPIKVLAVCENKNITDMIANPGEYWKTSHYGVGPVQSYGEVDMSRLDIHQIWKIEDPYKTAQEIGEYEAEVLLIDFHLHPWRGELLLVELVQQARKFKYKRPQYILGISESSYGNRLLMSEGADGYIKKTVLYGWDKWPKIKGSIPKTVQMNKLPKYNELPEYIEEKEKTLDQYLRHLESLQSSGTLDLYRSERGFQHFFVNTTNFEKMDGIPYLEAEKIFYDFIGADEPATYPNGTLVEVPAVMAPTPEKEPDRLLEALVNGPVIDMDPELKKKQQEEIERLRKMKEKELERREKEERQKQYQ